MDEAIAYFENMEHEFSKFEEERSKKIKIVYKKTLTEMSRIAYQQEADNVKIVAAEVLGLNHSIIANLRNVLKLKDQDSFLTIIKTTNRIPNRFRPIRFIHGFQKTTKAHCANNHKRD